MRLGSPRDLTANEADVLARLVGSARTGDRETALCQLQSARVIEECQSDRCGSIILEVDRALCPGFAWQNALFVQASDLRSPPTEVLLHVRGGSLWYLEVVTYVEDPQVLPSADSLTYLGGQDLHSANLRV